LHERLGALVVHFSRVPVERTVILAHVIAGPMAIAVN
jgi:hypothetical protein